MYNAEAASSLVRVRVLDRDADRRRVHFDVSSKSSTDQPFTTAICAPNEASEGEIKYARRERADTRGGARGAVAGGGLPPRAARWRGRTRREDAGTRAALSGAEKREADPRESRRQRASKIKVMRCFLFRLDSCIILASILASAI